MYEFRIEIGDPSNDGHGRCEVFNLLCNKSTEQIEKAYKSVCKKTGLSFTENDNYNEIDWKQSEYDDRRICVEYGSSKISDLAINILKEYNIEIEDNYLGSDELLEIFMNFIKIELNDIEYQIISDKSKVLNITIGYGLFE